MGDRTAVTLTFLHEHAEQVLAIIKKSHCKPDPYRLIGDSLQQSDGVILTSLVFDEVNYGKLPFEDQLTEQGIACTCDSNSEYTNTAFIRHSRYTKEGIHSYKFVDQEDYYVGVEYLMSLLSNTSQLNQYITDQYKRITPLKWTNQAEYGRLYRAVQLIAPTPVEF